MKFDTLHMLFLIWVVPVLLLIVLRGNLKRRTIMKTFAKPRGLSAIAWEASSLRRWIKAGLLLTALLFIALALAGPQYGYKWREVERRGVDLIIAIDCSRSMLATDIKPTRLERAKREISDLLNMLAGDRIGLVGFSGVSFLQCPLTLDYSAFYLFLESLTPDFLPVGGTDLEAAISSALKGFDEKSDTDKAIILITDGESTSGDPLAAAEAAAKAEVKIFSIGVGKADGVPVTEKDGGFKKDNAGNIVLTRLDEAVLKKIALITGGAYVRSVAGDMDLDTIYLGEIRGKMEQATLNSGREQIWENRFQWFVALAVMALLAEMLIPAARKAPMILLCLFSILLLGSPDIATADTADSLRQGRDAYEKGAFEEALKHFIDAQLARPDDPTAYYNVGNAYYKNGDYETARLHYQKALESEDKEVKQKSYYNMGNAYFRQNKIKEAIEQYEKALELNAEDPETAQNLEFAKRALEKQQEASQNQSSDNEQKQDGENEPSESETKPDEKDSGKDSQPKKDGQEPDSQSNQQKGPQSPPESQEQQNQAGEDAQKPEQEDENKNGTEQAQASSDQSQEERVDKEQLERILNRLQDRPGAAMMPSYGKQQVEKDW
jgi:Ca-activated chloride channel family protein